MFLLFVGCLLLFFVDLTFCLLSVVFLGQHRSFVGASSVGASSEVFTARQNTTNAQVIFSPRQKTKMPKQTESLPGSDMYVQLSITEGFSFFT